MKILNKLIIGWLICLTPSSNRIIEKSQNEIWEVFKIEKNDNIQKIEEIEKETKKDFSRYTNLLDYVDWVNFSNKENIIVEIDIKKLYNKPLFMQWTSPHIWAFLWHSQYEEIMKKYNSIDSADINIYNYKKIRFPLIYDELKNILPKYLDTLLLNKEFTEYKNDTNNLDTSIIILKKYYQEKDVLAFYLNKELFLATYISTWLYKWWTPNWIFKIKDKFPRNRSEIYDNAPTPYFLRIDINLWIHQWKSDWKPRSHWCIRVPWLYQQILFHQAKKWWNVIISENLKFNSSQEFNLQPSYPPYRLDQNQEHPLSSQPQLPELYFEPSEMFWQ